MSRIGKSPINIPEGVTVTISENEIVVKGKLGELSEKTHPLVLVEQKDNQILVDVKNRENKSQASLWGLHRSLIQNMVTGVETEYKKELEINGVGYKVEKKGKDLELKVGFSHVVNFEVPEGINVEINKNVITVTGISKQKVGAVAANIRKIKKPEPYKGKGIKYVDEVIKRKVGKTAAKSE